MVKNKVFTLNEEHRAIIMHYVNYFDFKSEVDFIRYLIDNFHNSKDPDRQLKELLISKERLTKELEDLKNKEMELESLKRLNILNKEDKEIKLKKAIELVANMINKHYSDDKWKNSAIYWAKEIPYNIDRLITLAQLKAHSKI